MLDVQSLTKWYGAIRAVSDVSFTLAAGEVLGYLGPNGSGKTTTVGMMTGDGRPERRRPSGSAAPTSRTIRSTIAATSATFPRSRTSIPT